MSQTDNKFYIKKLKLNNFMSYYGRVDFEFVQKGVNVFWGKNGSVKSNILIALHFAFTGEQQPLNFQEKKEKIINTKAISKGITEASVDVEYFYNDSTYILQRLIDDNNKQETILMKGNDLLSPKNIRNHLKEIIPPELSYFYMFNRLS